MKLSIKTMHAVVVGTVVSLCVALACVGCGGGTTPDLVVTASLIMPDGTEKSLTDAPLPLNMSIRVTFPEAVDTTLAESLFSLTGRGRTVLTINSWNAEGTVMTAKPRDYLRNSTTYTVSIAAGSVTADLSSGKANVAAYSETFTTATAYDINGDGLADPFLRATGWNAGGGTGRAYLFYGDTIVSGSAASADAIVTGEAAGDFMSVLFVNDFSLLFDLNDDGYDDLYNFSIQYPVGGLNGRTYIRYGGTGETPVSGAIGAASADLVMTGSAAADTFFTPYVRDVNGDGFSDLLGGARGYSGSTGRIYAFYGPTFASGDADAADVTITGENAGDFFGSAVRFGDFNGDGVADIVAQAPFLDGSTGRLYVFNGGDSLASGAASVADVVITGETAGDTLMARTVGDVNGDGVLDIVASAYGYNAGDGRAYVFYGGSSMASGSAGGADVILTGEVGSVGGFGGTLFAGDVNGDGIDDLIVAAPGYNTNAGRLYGFLGGSLTSKGAEEADFILSGENANDLFGVAGVGDVSGDGVDDIIGAASGYPAGANRGRVYVFFGASTMSDQGAGSADVILTGENDADRFGVAMVEILDVNGDGVMDIIVGAPAYNAGGNTGRAYLFYGGSGLASGDATSASVIIDGESAGDILSQ